MQKSEGNFNQVKLIGMEEDRHIKEIWVYNLF